MGVAKQVEKMRKALRGEARVGSDGVRQFDYEVRNQLVSHGVFYHFMISGPDDETAVRELTRKARVPNNIVKISALPFGGDLDRAIRVITSPHIQSAIQRALSEPTIRGQSLSYLLVIRTSIIGTTSAVAEEVGRIATSMFGDSFVLLAYRAPLNSLDLHYRRILVTRVARVAGLVSNGRTLPVIYPLAEYAVHPLDFHRGLIAHHLFHFLSGVERSGDPVNILRGLTSPLQGGSEEYQGLPLAIPLFISPVGDPSASRQSVICQLSQLTWEHPAVFRIGRFLDLEPLFDAVSVVGCLYAPMMKDGERLLGEVESLISDSLRRLGINDVGPNIRLVDSPNYRLVLLIGPMLARRFYLAGNRDLVLNFGIHGNVSLGQGVGYGR